MSKLRPYQNDTKYGVYEAWNNGYKNVAAILPTGAGKTVTVSSIISEMGLPSVTIAHRQELLGQISLAIAREGIPHDLITPKSSNLRRKIIELHMKKLGRNFITDRTKTYVGGVDTIINMHDDKRWRDIGLVTIDEAHHVLKHNKWGKVFEYFPNALGLFPTATPRRADRKGLGRSSDGIIDYMVEGVTMRELINMGYLTDYRVLCPKASDLDMSKVDISATTGDYNIDQVKKAIRKSTKIVGDLVKHYLQHANGKLGVTFAVDVEEAVKISQAFNAAGVPAEVVSAKTPDLLRSTIIDRFERREILQLVNVDLFGEGFDLPAIEVVSMARPTKSFSLFVQQFGRALRLMVSPVLMGAWDSYTDAGRREHIAQSSKPYALIIDHVGNIVEHRFPDMPQTWSLDAGQKAERGAPSDAIPLTTCLNVECLQPYERMEVCCPYCGEARPEPTGRTLELVDGDLQLLTEDVLAKMRGDVAKIDAPVYVPKNLDPHIRVSIINKHVARQQAQKELRHTIALWAGKHYDDEDRVNHKRFYLTFKLSVLDAMALGSREASELNQKILLTL